MCSRWSLGKRWSRKRNCAIPNWRNLFGCVLASLYEGLSVRPSLGPFVGPSVSIKEKRRGRTNLMAVYPALLFFKQEQKPTWDESLLVTGLAQLHRYLWILHLFCCCRYPLWVVYILFVEFLFCLFVYLFFESVFVGVAFVSCSATSV